MQTKEKVFLFISKKGDSLAIAQRIKQENNKVIFYINDTRYSDIGDGLVEKPPVSESVIYDVGYINRAPLDKLLLAKPDLIIIDSAATTYGALADLLRREGWNVFGSSLFSEQVEFDDAYTLMLMEVCKIKIPSPQLEVDLKDCVLVSTEVWYNGSECSGITHSLEYNNLMEHSIGPLCSGMGTLVWEGKLKSRIYKEGLGRITPYLKKTNYKGPITLHSLITPDALYGLNINCRFRFPCLCAFLEIYKGRIGDFFLALSKGYSRNIIFKAPFAIAVSLVVAPFPLDIPQQMSKDLLVKGIEEDNLKHLWLRDVKKLEEEDYVCAGTSGNIGCATARGDAVRETQRRVYRTVSNLPIHEVMYRRDIGEGYNTTIANLHNWGWLKE